MCPDERFKVATENKAVEDFNARFIDPFIEGVQKSLKEMCNTVARVEQFGELKDLGTVAIAIEGVIAVSGKSLQGTMTFGFTQSAFISVMNAMLGEKYVEIVPEVADGAAELTNIVFGHAKKILNEQGHEIRMARPHVVQGTDIHARMPTADFRSGILFSVPNGQVLVEFHMKDMSKASDAQATADQLVAQPLSAGNDTSGTTGLKAADIADAALKQVTAKLDGSVPLAFVQAVQKAFQVQAKLEMRYGKPFFREEGSTLGYDLGASIPVAAANTYGGNFTLYMKKESFEKLVRAMFGAETMEVTPDYEDAIAELINISFGIAKQELNARGHQLQPALPTLLRGKDLRTLVPAARPPIVVPCTLPSLGGELWIEFMLYADAGTMKKAG